MSVDSINEPGKSRETSHVPRSINEPPELPPAPAPVVSGLNPSSCAIGDPDFTLEVAGENFYSGSVIHFAGHDEPTTLTDGVLTTGIKPSLWTSPAVVKCSVFNGETQSNELDFEFTEPGAARARHGHLVQHAADPDELEDELEEAEEEGDFKPLHAPKPKRKK